ncbi:TetR/AcrR family transcriptional regulator [Ruania alkalisoli]|uniref:TetR/AcrR family transcriptional regulator n=1 Tax=Ruania alkalisoli TaxID=2779775 RepID=A0A7M1SVR8_9MICO|nr:TetR/AcrR family transcriptional regulator [Ruania alkalisoli]QOR71625.1 TetR/AcrR family transcriptional regulator [Ruania alkalisoli]
MTITRVGQREATLEKIRTAAVALFAEHDYNEITMQAVAKEAGIGEATLFRHVDQKVDLLTLAYSSQLDDLLNEIDEADATRALSQARHSGAHLRERILAIYEARCEFYRRHPVNGALYLAEGFNERNPARARNIAQGDRSIRLVAGLIEEGQRSGALFSHVVARDVAQNCHGIYMHEIQRTAVRNFEPDSIWTRTRARLLAQLDPLIVDGSR